MKIIAEINLIMLGYGLIWVNTETIKKWGKNHENESFSIYVEGGY